MTTNLAYQQWLAESDDSIVFLDKADGGKVTMDDVQGGLKEYERLFKAGLASPAELITLHRAYPNVPKYANVVDILDLNGEEEPTVIGGPASVELVDREGHLITSEALEEAFERYMDNFRTRNVMVMHSDVQVGHALPVYISRGGQIFKSGVDGDNLFFISELRDDTKISKKVKEQINSGKMRSYSIAGSATKTKNISKGADSYMQVDSLELAEVTICEKGVNQGAHFELMKAEQPVPTESDNNLFVISKEDVPSFTEVFSTWLGKASKEGIVPELNGKQMAVLENGTARQIQHRALLDEMGFPMYVYPENLRHPVDYDEPGCPVPAKIVNQAGQDLGDPNVEEMVKSATDTFTYLLSKGRAKKDLEKVGFLAAVPGAIASTARGVGEAGAGIAEGAGELVGGVGRGVREAGKGITGIGDKEKSMPKEKGLGDILAAPIKTVGGAVAGGAAGLTGSKQSTDWGGGDEEGDPEVSEKGLMGALAGGAARGAAHSAADSVSGAGTPELKSLKKSTDIFKRVLEAERPDETWTGTDKEKDVPMEKIIGALLAPVAGVIGAAAGAGLSAAGGIAGGAAKKLVSGG
jgi:hypothetical protein